MWGWVKVSHLLPGVLSEALMKRVSLSFGKTSVGNLL